MDDSSILKNLLSDLRSFDKQKRRTAVVKLGLEGSDEAVRALIMTVSNCHEDTIARGKAALMLGKLHDLRAVESLIQALKAPGRDTPVNAAWALGQIGDPMAIHPLVTATFSSSETLVATAKESLKRLGYYQSEMETEHDLV